MKPLVTSLCRFSALLSLFVGFLVLSGCSSVQRSDNQQGKGLHKDHYSAALEQNGTFIVARIFPKKTEAHLLEGQRQQQLRVMGFLPVASSNILNAPVLDTKLFLNVSKVNSSLQVTGIDHTFDVELSHELPAGQYEVVLRQSSPVWYASDEYFLSRGLTVPASGSKERFLHAALGDRAIFLRPLAETGSEPAALQSLLIIHDGEHVLAEEHNIRMSDSVALESLYQQAEEGKKLIITD